MTDGQPDWVGRARSVLSLPDDAHIRLLGEGQMSVAAMVGHTTVLRFPRHQIGVSHLRTERALVPRIAARTSAVLPRPGQAELDRPIGRAYACHALVPGTVLTGEVVAAMDDVERDQLVGQLSDLLNGFRRAGQDPSEEADPLSSAQSMTGSPGSAALRLPPLPFGSLSDLSEHLRDEVESLLPARLSIRAARRASAELDRMAAAGPTQFVPTAPGPWGLVHGDLGGNLVWDPARSRLGVIDFGGAMLSDPALDLASLSVLGRDLAVDVATRTPHLADRMDAVDAIRATFRLQDALFSARQQDWAAVEATLSGY